MLDRVSSCSIEGESVRCGRVSSCNGEKGASVGCGRTCGERRQVPLWCSSMMLSSCMEVPGCKEPESEELG